MTRIFPLFITCSQYIYLADSAVPAGEEGAATLPPAFFDAESPLQLGSFTISPSAFSIEAGTSKQVDVTFISTRASQESIDLAVVCDGCPVCNNISLLLLSLTHTHTLSLSLFLSLS